jgi:hypothetical protein
LVEQTKEGCPAVLRYRYPEFSFEYSFETRQSILLTQ